MEKVYLYIADIENFDAAAVMPMLSEERQARVTRCVDAKKKHQLAASELVCAYALRDLGETAQLPLSFAKDENGKPYIEGGKWQFNLSHSGTRVCCAVSDMPVGADVQKMEERDFEKLAQKFCSAQEFLRLMRFAGEQRKQFFYEFWARKEALAKRDSVGAGTDFKKVDVTKWHVCCLTQGEYMYAVAAGKAFELVVRNLPKNWL